MIKSGRIKSEADPNFPITRGGWRGVERSSNGSSDDWKRSLTTVAMKISIEFSEQLAWRFETLEKFGKCTRMGTALRNLVATSKAQKQSLAGKGKLTQEKITKIQNYYGRAIKDNANDVDLMKKRIFAILFHMSSSNEHPKHTHCPPGAKSWCFWQRAAAKGEMPGSHKEHETLPADIGKSLHQYFKGCRMIIS